MYTNNLQRWVMLLAVVFLLLLTGMFYVLWRDNQQNTQSTQSNDQAQHMVIKREGFDEIVLRKTDDSWKMESPCQVSINEQRLAPLLEVLTPAAHQYTAQEVDLDAAGLTSPLANVVIDGIDYRLGNTDLQGARRYVQYGNQVGFVPEWTLPLVNGGVTALANLNVFDDTLSALTVLAQGEADNGISDTEELARWQQLSAQQIVPWPLDGESPEAVFSIVPELENNVQTTISVFNAESFIALQYENTACAFIIAPESLPN